MVRVGDVVRLNDRGWDWVDSCARGVTRWELFVVTGVPDFESIEAARLMDPQHTWDLYHEEVEPCAINPET